MVPGYNSWYIRIQNDDLGGHGMISLRWQPVYSMLTHIIVLASSTLGEFFENFQKLVAFWIGLLNAEAVVVIVEMFLDRMSHGLIWSHTDMSLSSRLTQCLPTSWKEMVKSSSSLTHQVQMMYLRDTLQWKCSSRMIHISMRGFKCWRIVSQSLNVQ